MVVILLQILSKITLNINNLICSKPHLLTANVRRKNLVSRLGVAKAAPVAMSASIYREREGGMGAVGREQREMEAEGREEGRWGQTGGRRWAEGRRGREGG